MTSTVFSNLRKVLADLYEDRSDIARILGDVGINQSKINFENSAQNIWHEALKEAEKKGKVNDLLDKVNTKEEYGENSDFQAAYRAYCKSMRGKVKTSQTTKSNLASVRDRIIASLILMIVIVIVVFFTYPTFSGIRSNLNHIFKGIGVTEITTERITATSETNTTGTITTASAITSQPTIHNASLIGRVAKVDPVTAWNKLCLRESSLDRETCMEMQAGDEVTLLSNNKDGWVQVEHNQSNKKGYVVLRYLLFTKVQDTYINLFWRYKNPGDTVNDDCISAPRLELLSVNQPEDFCDPNVPVMSLDKLEEVLHKYEMLDPDESIHPWTVDNGDSIIVKTGDNHESDFIKIGKDYPLSKGKRFLVGAIWREKTNERMPVGKICWLRNANEWFCEDI